MNLMITTRVIAVQLLSSSRSSRLLFVSLYPNVILQQNSMYSTTLKNMPSSWKKPNSSSRKPKTQYPVEKSPTLCSSVTSVQQIQKKPSLVSVDWPRPSEIPLQDKLANSVNLIGRLQVPVQFQASLDGKYWAATIIAQEDSISFRIPLIFEGDLAYIAACHLKEKDCVYVDGQLSSDPPPITLINEQSSFQVMVHNINFVEGSSLPKKSFRSHKFLVHLENVKADTTYQKKESKEDDYQRKESVKDGTSVDQSLIGLITKPHEWWDIRLKQGNSKSAAFEHKVDGKLLQVNKSTPDWIRKKLECLTFEHKVKKKSSKASMTKDADLILNSWRDLLKNPKHWRDHRENKLNGSVKPKHPDFKHKDSGVGLWLNSAPIWVLPGLEGLEFDGPFQKKKKKDQ